MRAGKFVLAGCAAMVLAGGAAGSAYAVRSAGGAGSPSSLPQADPATVPQSCPPASGTLPCGELVTESRVSTPFTLKVGTQPAHVLPNGAEVTVEHDQIPAGTSTGWHSHGGPVLVEIVSGSLTLYEASDPSCAGTAYGPGTGFLEFGYGNVHDARNEGDTPADIYVEYILPPGSGDTGLWTPQPDNSNPHCAWAS